jgi:hypothetical protein
MIASTQTPARLAVFGEDDAKAVTVQTRFDAVDVLAMAYPPAPAGTSMVYVIAPTGSAIISAAESAEQCTAVHGYPNIVACSVEAGATVTVQGAQ